MRVSENRRALRTALGATWISDDWNTSTTRVNVTRVGTSRRGGGNFGCSCQCQWQAMEYQQQGRERQRQRCEHLESPSSCLGKISSLEILLVHLEIIATAYHWMIFKTHVFTSMHPCIYITSNLHTQSLNWLQEFICSNSTCPLQMTIEWTQRFTCKLWGSECGDALWRPGSRKLRGGDRAWLEAVIGRTSRCTTRLWLSMFGDALLGHHWANLEAMIERVWRRTWEVMITLPCRTWSREFRDTHGCCVRAKLEEYLEAVNSPCPRFWESILHLCNSKPCECEKLSSL